MIRRGVTFCMANELKQRARLCKVRMCTGQQNWSSTTAYHTTTIYQRENRWIPYSVDVAVAYFKSRTETAKFKAVCIDTAAELSEEVKAKMPTILCTQGSGGSHEEFIPMLKSLVEDHGFRAVCVNWPGYGKTEGFTANDEELFKFRSEEYVNFLLSFLEQLNLARLDVVVSHSVGCVSASYICARGEKPASLVLIAPLPPKPFKGIQPHSVLRILAKLWQLKILRPFLKLFIQLEYTERGMNSNDPMYAVNATLTAARLNFKLIEHLALELEIKKRPTVFVYGGKDNFIEPSVLSELAPKYGVLQEHFDIYDEDKKIVQEGTPPKDHYSKGILFQAGGHSPHLKEAYIPILVKEILTLYKHTQNKKT